MAVKAYDFLGYSAKNNCQIEKWVYLFGKMW